MSTAADERKAKIRNFLTSDNTIKGFYLASIASISALVSFAYALGSTKKHNNPAAQAAQDVSAAQLHISGSQLAVRALKWGTLYAVSGVGVIIFAVWKLANVKDMAEFRQKMGTIVPAVPKNNPPQSRTEFGSVSEFMQYLDDEYSTKKIEETDESASTEDTKTEN